MLTRTLTLVLPLLFGATVGMADDDRDDRDTYPDEVTLRSVAYAGTGCPADSVRLNVPIDGRELMVYWTDFQAEAGPDVPLRDSRKNCQLNVDLAYPDGWQYTLTSIDYDGQHHLDEGVVATAASAYYFQSSPDTVRAQHDFTGPLAGEYNAFDAFPEDQLSWSPCGAGDNSRSLNVNVQVRVDTTTTTEGRRGVISFADSPDVPGSLLTLKWRRC